MKKHLTLASIGAALILLAITTTAPALSINGTGQITDWGITPFTNGTYGTWLNGPPIDPSGINGTQKGVTNGIHWTEGNNVSPVKFPGLIPNYVPSPTGTTGETFDMEFLAWRVVGTSLQVLGISSANPATGAIYNKTPLHIGDLFINADGNASTGYKGYDHAISMGNWTTNLADPLNNEAGYTHNLGQQVYDISGVQDVHGITDTASLGYGDNPVVAGAMDPFSIRTGAQVASNSNLTVNSQSFNYGTINGHNENSTWITEWQFDLAALGIEPQNAYKISLHWTIECGNDVIGTDPVVPEPATLALMGLGMVTLGIVRRRKNRR